MIPYLAISERITESFNDVEPLSKLTLSLIPSMLINSSRHILIAICASRADRAIKNRDVADSKERRRIRREKAKSRKRRRDAMNAFDSTPVKQRLHTMIRLLESDRMATDRNNRKFFYARARGSRHQGEYILVVVVIVFVLPVVKIKKNR